jgi:hypothetical protein
MASQTITFCSESIIWFVLSQSIYDGHYFDASIIDLSVIRSYVLRHKYNYQIHAKLCLVYGKVALCPRTVDTWAARFRSGRTSGEDHVFDLFHLLRVFFHQSTSEKRMIQFCLLYSNNFPSIVGSLSVLRPKMRAQSSWLHIDSIQTHDAALSLQKTEEVRFTRLPSPLYSHDLTPCDFFSFRYLKKQL